VYIASRSSDRVQDAIERMNQSVGEGKKLDVRFLKLNLEDLSSVKAAARWFAAQEDRLDILINNAGVMNAPYKLTVDRFESQWQVNYLAPHLLTTSLMPLLLATAAAAGTLDRVRVVNVVSNAAFFGPKTIQFEDVNMTDAKGMMVLWWVLSLFSGSRLLLTGPQATLRPREAGEHPRRQGDQRSLRCKG
jgi:NAD(P)-dependent dehydrogenase (short-subunit alcohol dehydrogenase family)